MSPHALQPRAAGPATRLSPSAPAITQPGGGIPLNTPGGTAPARPSRQPGPGSARTLIPARPRWAAAASGRCMPPALPSATGWRCLSRARPQGIAVLTARVQTTMRPGTDARQDDQDRRRTRKPLSASRHAASAAVMARGDPRRSSSRPRTRRGLRPGACRHCAPSPANPTRAIARTAGPPGVAGPDMARAVPAQARHKATATPAASTRHRAGTLTPTASSAPP